MSNGRKRFSALWLYSFGMRMFLPFFLLVIFTPLCAKDARAGSGSPLVVAVIKGESDMVAKLLEEGHDVDSRDKYGKTALMWAILKGRGGLARYLVEKGANVNAHDWEHTTSLMWAVVAGDRDMVRFLIDNNANLQKKDMYGDTALGMALKRRRNEIAEMLKKAGAVE